MVCFHTWAAAFRDARKARRPLPDGRRLRVLPIIDVYTRECLAIEVDASLTGERVARTLNRLKGRG